MGVVLLFSQRYQMLTSAGTSLKRVGLTSSRKCLHPPMLSYSLRQPGRLIWPALKVVPLQVSRVQYANSMFSAVEEREAIINAGCVSPVITTLQSSLARSQLPHANQVDHHLVLMCVAILANLSGEGRCSTANSKRYSIDFCLIRKSSEVNERG